MSIKKSRIKTLFEWQKAKKKRCNNFIKIKPF